MKKIWAIILAAGESKRMKLPKMLLPFRGSTIIEQVIENAVNSQVDNTVVVLGSGAAEIRKVISNWPVKHCINENFHEGMLSSVKCGFRSLPHNCEAALVFQGDQPLIKPEVADLLISEHRKRGKGIFIPVTGSKRGHPVLISSEHFENIFQLGKHETLKDLSLKYPGDVIEVDAGTSDIFKDIDTQEDYLRELKDK